MNQTQLGKKLGLTQNQISRYERGVMHPTLDTLVRIAQLLDTSTDYLLGLSSVPHPNADPDPEPELTSTERKMLELLRRYDISSQGRLITILRLAGRLHPTDGDVR
jgi:transcriptional regulator with XRE-family HTH domain